FRREQRMVFGIGLGLALSLCERGVEVYVIAIAERDDLDIGFFLKPSHHVAAAIARADDAEADAVIGAEDVVPTCGAHSQARGDCASRCVRDELTAWITFECHTNPFLVLVLKIYTS